VCGDSAAREARFQTDIAFRQVDGRLMALRIFEGSEKGAFMLCILQNVQCHVRLFQFLRILVAEIFHLGPKKDHSIPGCEAVGFHRQQQV
jgi:hypothetical protein